MSSASRTQITETWAVFHNPEHPFSRGDVESQCDVIGTAGDGTTRWRLASSSSNETHESPPAALYEALHDGLGVVAVRSPTGVRYPVRTYRRVTPADFPEGRRIRFRRYAFSGVVPVPGGQAGVGVNGSEDLGVVLCIENAADALFRVVVRSESDGAECSFFANGASHPPDFFGEVAPLPAPPATP